MQDVLHVIGIICAVLAGMGLAVSILLFIRFDVPTLWKDLSGQISQKELDKIREKSNAKNAQINVFEELEKKARGRSGDPQQRATGLLGRDRSRNINAAERHDEGTSVLSSPKKKRADFAIEKNIRFVSTNEVL